MIEIPSWEEFKELSQIEVCDWLEFIRKRENLHKYQMGQLLEMGENAYYVKISQTTSRSYFSKGEMLLIWYILFFGAPETFTAETKAKQKKFIPTFDQRPRSESATS